MLRQGAGHAALSVCALRWPAPRAPRGYEPGYERDCSLLLQLALCTSCIYYIQGHSLLTNQSMLRKQHSQAEQRFARVRRHVTRRSAQRYCGAHTAQSASSGAPSQPRAEQDSAAMNEGRAPRRAAGSEDQAPRCAAVTGGQALRRAAARLDKADVLGVLAEALPAYVEPVLADQAPVVGADAAARPHTALTASSRCPEEPAAQLVTAHSSQRKLPISGRACGATARRARAHHWRPPLPCVLLWLSHISAKPIAEVCALTTGRGDLRKHGA